MVTKVIATGIIVVSELDTNRNSQVSAVDIWNSAKEDDASDPGTNEAKVDDGDEGTRDITVSVELIEGGYCPCASEDWDNEEGEDIVWDVCFILNVWVDKPTEHANDGDGDEDFEDSNPWEEGGVENHVDDFSSAFLYMLFFDKI